MKIGDLVYLHGEEHEVGIIVSQQTWDASRFSDPMREIWWADDECASIEFERDLELFLASR